MNIKSEINIIQKQLLDRLNVRKGTTLFTIIQEISRQAFVKASLTVSQKNSTLAKKCNVTPSTISRNLKKLKEKCADLITIEQNRNNEEKFAALVFTFNCKENLQLENEMSNGMSNGQQTEQIKDSNEPIKQAENTSSLSTNPLILIKNNNKDFNTNIVKQDVNQDNIIFDTYMEFKQQGIDKTLFNKVLSEVQNKRGIRNFGAYLRGALSKVINHMNSKKKANDYMKFYDYLINTTNYDLNQSPLEYDWLNT
ncbi:MAG: hypothetical protein WAM95_13275 [Bacillus sp. (in: firmicutes)]